MCKPFEQGRDSNNDLEYIIKIIVDFKKNYPVKDKPKLEFVPIANIT